MATIGPQSENLDTLKKFSKYTNIFRLNGSHNTLEWHEKIIHRIRENFPNAFILLDVPGIKPRTANKKSLEIKKGTEILFGNPPLNSNKINVKLTKSLPNYDNTLKYFSINDGQFFFDVLERNKNYIIGKARSNFTLYPQKGLNLPNSVYDEEKQIETYIKFINRISKFDINGLGLSFVQSSEIIKTVNDLMPKLTLVAKIENSKGLENCEKIIDVADVIMIDRGDLSAEIHISNLYNAIETIVSKTKKARKSVIMATENLDSMINKEAPSKSDVVSIMHSLSIGTDCIMLSDETATAKNGLQILSWLSDFLKKVKPLKKKKISGNFNPFMS